MYQVIDQVTGEIVAENFIFFGKPKKHYDKNYVKFFTSFLDSIVENNEIAGKAIRLLFYLLSKMEYNNLTVTIIPKQVLRDLNISRQTFINWIRTLEKNDIIKRIDRHTIELKPYRFVKGSMKDTIRIEFEKWLKRKD